MLAHLTEAQTERQQVIGRESWEALLGAVEAASDAEAALSLMLADARVREDESWAWETDGYGRLVLMLVEVSARVGVEDMACRLVDLHARKLHLNTGSKDLLPGMMRRMVAAGVGSEALMPVFELEARQRGRNTHMAAHELSRVLRREENVEGVSMLIQQVEDGTVEMKDALLEDLARWLGNRRP